MWLDSQGQVHHYIHGRVCILINLNSQLLLLVVVSKPKYFSLTKICSEDSNVQILCDTTRIRYLTTIYSIHPTKIVM